MRYCEKHEHSYQDKHLECQVCSLEKRVIELEGLLRLVLPVTNGTQFDRVFEALKKSKFQKEI